MIKNIPNTLTLRKIKNVHHVENGKYDVAIGDEGARF
jgi:hypothetical protein